MSEVESFGDDYPSDMENDNGYDFNTQAVALTTIDGYLNTDEQIRENFGSEK